MHVAASATQDDVRADLDTSPRLSAIVMAALADVTPWADAPEARHPHAAREELGVPWTKALRAALADPHPDDRGLICLAMEYNLAAVELLTSALALEVEMDAMTGRVLAYLQLPTGGVRPTLGLLAAAYAALPPGQSPAHVLWSGKARQIGLLQVAGESSPVPERTVSVPLALCMALRGQECPLPGVSIGLAEEDRMPLPASYEREILRRAELLASGGTLIVRTGCPAEGRAVTAAAARRMGKRPAFLEGDPAVGLGLWLKLRSLLPIYQYDLAPSERKHLPHIEGYTGGVAVVSGLEGGFQTHGPEQEWRLTVPPAAEREDLWNVVLDHPQLAASLGRTHRHGVGRIAHLGRAAQLAALLRGNAHVEMQDVAAAAWKDEHNKLASLAQPLRDEVDDGAFVMPPSLASELNNLLLRCRSRDQLVEGLGASARARYRAGVRALLVGASGTGKTLAASWMAYKLGLPLYRVDLSNVTSKYIGETEKNLAQLLGAAEQMEVVLLFDEADSFFAKRTDVREANDRFANSQTNYLLQRIESYDGIVLLTSNSRSRFDPAFTRRLDTVIEFPLPGPEERRRLWESHLGDRHELSVAALNRVAGAADFTGGHIRNAVLFAAVVARDAGRTIGFDDVMAGIASEYRKLGRQTPAELRR